jgi:hypothetical protein
MFAVMGRGGIARTAASLPVVQLVAAAGLALAAWQILSASTSQAALSYLPLGLALAGYLVMQWYVWVYSRYGRKKGVTIVVGQTLPEVSFDRLDGGTISISDLKGSKVLFVFFRGNWCPLCTAQLREVRDRADALAMAGVSVKFVSNQDAALSLGLAG